MPRFIIISDSLYTMKKKLLKYYKILKCVQAIKIAMDQEYSSGESRWAVVVGTDFRYHIAHDEQNIILLYIGPVAFLVWKHN